MEYTFVYPAFAAFAIQHSAPRPFTKTKSGEYVLVSLGFLCVVLFVIFSGLRLQGKYEVKPDGTGLIPWRQIRFDDSDTNRVLSTSHCLPR